MQRPWLTTSFLADGLRRLQKSGPSETGASAVSRPAFQVCERGALVHQR